MVALLGACGRLGFDDVHGSGDDAGGGDDGGVLPVARIEVTPRWAPPTGTQISVTFLDETDATGATVTIDGAACTNPSVNGNSVSCTAPAHASGVVALAARAGTTDEMIGFNYLALGPALMGGTLDDASSGVAFDSAGNTYVVGATTGSFDQPNAGDQDALIVKFDGAGGVAWTREFGTTAYDYLRDVVVDRFDEITVVGYTAASLGGPSAGSNDVFVARYHPDGTRRWITQLGSAGDDQAWDLAVDAAGYTVVALRTNGNLAGTSAGNFDYGIARLDPDGAVAWIRQDGTSANDIGHSITVAADGVAYLVGYTNGSVENGVANAGLLDLFVARYETDGTRSWIHQRGGPGEERAQDATIDDDGNIWVVGSTANGFDGQAALGTTGLDVFVTRWSPSGACAFTRLFGGELDQNSFAIAVPPGGPAILGCSTGGPFDGQAAYGGTDICAIGLDRDGTRRWTRILGTAAYDTVSAGAIGPAFTNLVLFSVITNGALGGVPNQGSADLGFVRYDLDGNAY